MCPLSILGTHGFINPDRLHMYTLQLLHTLLLYRANLVEFADLLIRHGVVNAINLDGGGSSTLVEDNVLINYPSDHW